MQDVYLAVIANSQKKEHEQLSFGSASSTSTHQRECWKAFVQRNVSPINNSQLSYELKHVCSAIHFIQSGYHIVPIVRIVEFSLELDTATIYLVLLNYHVTRKKKEHLWATNSNE